MPSERLLIYATHPVQYHAPVYREVERLGLPVTVVYESDKSVAGYTDAEFGVPVRWDTDLLSGYTPIFLSRTGTPSARLAGRARGLRRLTAGSKAGALLVTGYATPFHRVAISCALASGAPVMFRAETTDHALARTALRSGLRDLLLRGLYSRCAACLHIGERSLAHYRRLGVGEHKLVFSPYCVSLEAFAPAEEDRRRLRDAARRELGIAPEERVLMFSGKLSPRKGPELLLSALEELQREGGGSWSALFVGDGQLRAELERRRSGVPVRFTGFQPQSALSPFFHASDVFALPSVASETWGLVTNEALHHGLPVVVSDAVGCAPDLAVAGRCGEVFASGSSSAMAAALRRLAGWWTNDEGSRRICRDTIAPYSVSAAARGIIQGYGIARRAASTGRG